MPHRTCGGCGFRIPSTTKKIRKLTEPLLWAQMLETGGDIPYGSVICEHCRDNIIRSYKAISLELETDAIESSSSTENVSLDQNLVNEDLVGACEDVAEEISTHLTYGQDESVNNLARIAHDYMSLETDDAEILDESAERKKEDIVVNEEEYQQIMMNLLTPPDVITDDEYEDSEEEDDEAESLLLEESQILLAEAIYSESSSSEISSVIEMVSQEFEFESSDSQNVSPKRRKARNASQGKKIFVEDVLSVAATESRCFVCRFQNTKRHRVPETAILDLWIKHRVLVPRGRVRCCSDHLKSDETFKEDAIKRIVLHAQKGANLTSQEFGTWLNRLADQANKKGAVLDFNSTSMRDEDYKLLTGLYKANFDDLLGYIESSLNNSKHRNPRNALAMFLILLRLAVSQTFISYLFGLPVQRVSDVIATVSNLLHTKFVPIYLGYKHLTRGAAQAHVPQFVRSLYDVSPDSLALVYDATYLYIQKPQDFRAQRETYSMQKKRNLVKPMMVVFPDGYILEAEGMYKANTRNNDAGILLHMLSKKEGISTFITEKDHSIVDRGFRDAVKELRKRKLIVHMPQLLQGTRQFTTEQANLSRKVTLTRWAVEAVNGRIKHVFRFFDHVIHNSYIFGNKLKMMFRVGCAILNAYFPPLYEDQEKHQIILDAVNEKMKKKNSLKAMVEKNGWDKRKDPRWIRATSNNFPNFPKLTEADIFDITCGVWQTKNAILYTKQHIDQDSEYAILVHTEEENIIRAHIHSRFHSSDFHKLWIQLDTSKTGSDQIVRSYCRCKNGARSFGTCSHITSVLWYMGYFRHQGKEIRKKSFCSILLDAAEIVESAEVDNVEEN